MLNKVIVDSRFRPDVQPAMFTIVEYVVVPAVTLSLLRSTYATHVEPTA